MNSPLSETLRNMRTKDLVYPGTTIVFLIIIVVLFGMVAQFLSRSINNAIATPDESAIKEQLTHIDKDSYRAVAKKLNLPAEQQSTEPQATSTEVQATSTPSVETMHPSMNRSSITIAVFNSTKKSGLAGILRDDLTKAGFTVTKTGNRTPEEPQTTISIKEKIQSDPTIVDELTSVTGKRFSTTDPQLLDESNPYDVLIIIGTK